MGAFEQALEIATWAALLKAPRAVLAGDHLQLPPTIISDQAASQVRLTLSGLLFCCSVAAPDALGRRDKSQLHQQGPCHVSSQSNGTLLTLIPQ